MEGCGYDEDEWAVTDLNMSWVVEIEGIRETSEGIEFGKRENEIQRESVCDLSGCQESEGKESGDGFLNHFVLLFPPSKLRNEDFFPIKMLMFFKCH